MYIVPPIAFQPYRSPTYVATFVMVGKFLDRTLKGLLDLYFTNKSHRMVSKPNPGRLDSRLAVALLILSIIDGVPNAPAQITTTSG